MKKFVVLEKGVGETPLACAEKWRAEQSDVYRSVPLAYAGRLDPMASGKLLVLIGDECKQQEKYHGLDKEYEFEVLFGIQSDTADVLGLVSSCDVLDFSRAEIQHITKKLTETIELPYPHYSSKTVQGKPLHTWALEGKIDEIEIPTKKSVVHKLTLTELKKAPAETIYKVASDKIESIPKVTELRKAIGNDFRRDDVRKCWENISKTNTNETYVIARFTCIASSGTYMRTLAEVIAKELGTCGLAFSIHRTKIGLYKKLFGKFGFWPKTFA